MIRLHSNTQDPKRGWAPHDALFVDDSVRHVESAAENCEVLLQVLVMVPIRGRLMSKRNFHLCQSFADHFLISVANPPVQLCATFPPEQVIRVQGNGLSGLELDAIEATELAVHSPHIWSLLHPDLVLEICCHRCPLQFIINLHMSYVSIVFMVFSVFPSSSSVQQHQP